MVIVILKIITNLSHQNFLFNYVSSRKSDPDYRNNPGHPTYYNYINPKPDEVHLLIRDYKLWLCMAISMQD